MKNYILLFFGSVSVGTYAADVMEYIVFADIPYYNNEDSMQAGQPSGYVTIEMTPTLTFQDMNNEAERQVGPGILMFDRPTFKMRAHLPERRSIATLYGETGNTINGTKNKLKDFIERSFSFVLATQ
jgi:hypothetical protein